MNKIKLLYNPRAGDKKHLFSRAKPQLLQDIFALLRKYEIEFDATESHQSGDIRRLAEEAASQGYELVLVAGGDGTVGEAASGLVGSDTALGILPLGTFMNVARMLSVPLDLEAAVMLIKMGNIRSLDVGEIMVLADKQVDGQTLSGPGYFLESVGIGYEADFQKFYLSYKQHRWQSLIRLLKDARLFYNSPLRIELDGNRIIESKAQTVMISNGPDMGANLSVAPEAKLNDHLLTLTLYKISKKELLWHLLRLKMPGHKFFSATIKDNPAISSYTSTTVKISSSHQRPVDADARIFGHTPISVQVRPKAIKVVAGFVEAHQESGMIQKNIYLDD